MTSVRTEHRELKLDAYLLGREGVATVNTPVSVSLSVNGLETRTLSQPRSFGLVTANAGPVYSQASAGKCIDLKGYFGNDGQSAYVQKNGVLCN